MAWNSRTKWWWWFRNLIVHCIEETVQRLMCKLLKNKTELQQVVFFFWGGGLNNNILTLGKFRYNLFFNCTSILIYRSKIGCSWVYLTLKALVYCNWPTIWLTTKTTNLICPYVCDVYTWANQRYGTYRKEKGQSLAPGPLPASSCWGSADLRRVNTGAQR